MTELSCAGILWLTLSTLAALGASSGFFLPYWLRGTYPPPSQSHSQPHRPAPTLAYPVPVFLNTWRRCNYPRLATAPSHPLRQDDDGGSVRRRSGDNGDRGGGRAAVEGVAGRGGGRGGVGGDRDDASGGSISSKGGSARDGGTGVGEGAEDPLLHPGGRGGGPPGPRGSTVELVPECGRYASFLDIPSVWWQIGTVLAGTGSAVALLVAMAGAWALCVRYVLTKGTAKVAAALQAMAGLLIGGATALYPLGWGSQEIQQVCGQSFVFRLGDCELYWAFYLTASAGGLTLICSTLAICAPSSKAQYS